MQHLLATIAMNMCVYIITTDYYKNCSLYIIQSIVTNVSLS